MRVVAIWRIRWAVCLASARGAQMLGQWDEMARHCRAAVGAQAQAVMAEALVAGRAALVVLVLLGGADIPLEVPAPAAPICSGVDCVVEVVR